MYMAGCELKEAYPIVPLAERHALSIGMTTIQDRACFGLYADRQALGDVDRVADALERSTCTLRSTSCVPPWSHGRHHARPASGSGTGPRSSSCPTPTT